MIWKSNDSLYFCVCVYIVARYLNDLSIQQMGIYANMYKSVANKVSMHSCVWMCVHVQPKVTLFGSQWAAVTVFQG